MINLNGKSSNQLISRYVDVFALELLGREHIVSAVGLSVGLGIRDFSPSFFPVMTNALIGSEKIMGIGVGTLI